MSVGERQIVLDSRVRAFDVICAGDAVLTVPEGAGFRATSERLTFRPGGGAVNAAIALAAQGLRVGLATVLSDDSAGRALREKVAASGVDVGGVELANASRGLVLVRGGARQVLSFRDEEQPISVPATWQSQVLLLSGMSPVVSHGAALCKAARAARRAGSIVVVDVNARWNLWEGRDHRSIRMVLREADVVWCDAQDLFGLDLDFPALRAAMRPNAVVVSSNGAGRVSAIGPFGEIASQGGESAALAALREDDAFAVAICAELARAGHTDESGGALWARALELAQAVRLDERRSR